MVMALKIKVCMNKSGCSFYLHRFSSSSPSSTISVSSITPICERLSRSVVVIIPKTYLEYHALTNAMDTLKSRPGAAKMSPAKIKESLINSLWVNYATDNIQRKHMRITRSDGVKVRVAYEVRREFVGNVDFIVKFDRTVSLK